MNMILVLAICLPLVSGLLLPFLKIEEKQRKKRNLYCIINVCITSVLIFILLMNQSEVSFELIALNEQMCIAYQVDGLAKVFLLLIGVLWPIATLYSFEYMEHDPKQTKFFTFYVATYGVVVGLATSANLITFYLMYEMLTFITLPLVMHAMDNRAIRAGRKYLIYSISGAAMAFIGMMMVSYYAGSLDFVYGGLDFASSAYSTEILIAYLLCFFGFGVKAAVFPFHGWLPEAGVAPTPVTALLHAVAVVKAGVFAIARVTYYIFGASLLYGTFAQTIVMGFSIFTIVFGSAMAYRQVHLKKRLAYSTVSNLSYILFGLTLMSPLGLAAAMAHMLFHGVIKICLFFCVGGVMELTHRENLTEIYGFGYVMPVTFTCFTIGAMALSGVPLFAGFVSKYALAQAAISSLDYMAYLGVGALLISAILTAAYTFEVSITAFFPRHRFNMDNLKGIHDPTWRMKAPFIILCLLMLLLGVCSTPIIDTLTSIANGWM